MERAPVTSSNLISIGYDPASETLEVEFKGGVYQYYNVPQFIYDQLMQATSLGIFFNANIKNAYPCSRV